MRCTKKVGRVNTYQSSCNRLTYNNLYISNRFSASFLPFLVLPEELRGRSSPAKIAIRGYRALSAWLRPDLNESYSSTSRCTRKLLLFTIAFGLCPTSMVQFDAEPRSGQRGTRRMSVH